ncbi:MAG: DUF1127 domain-containing protein [Sphingomicrobium sp.]
MGFSSGAGSRFAVAIGALAGRNAMQSLFALAKRLAGIFRHRREARILAGLDAHMLADIGLNRADLRDAFAAPLWRDPTQILERRAGERRMYKRSELNAATLAPDRRTLKYPPTDRPARLHL